MKQTTIFLFLLIASIAIISSCKDDETSSTPEDEASAFSVDPTLFLDGGLAEPITIESRTLSDGTTADCYKIVVTSLATDHDMGPWCPSNIADDASAGGIWLEGGEAYDVDGEFVKNLATFYEDSKWMLYDSVSGNITKTETQQECEDAANPNVGAEYENYCVECLPSYVANLTHTYYIPVTPKAASSANSFGMGPRDPGPSVRGLAFNGVVFDAPAPVSNILGAYTLAPFDDAGGHINLAAGYHYHAATGLSTKVTQADGHAAMIGYALDGYPMHEHTDADGNEYTDLDASLGHTDDTRGYHYHVDYKGTNNFINSLHGEYAE